MEALLNFVAEYPTFSLLTIGALAAVTWVSVRIIKARTVIQTAGRDAIHVSVKGSGAKVSVRK